MSQKIPREKAPYAAPQGEESPAVNFGLPAKQLNHDFI